MNMEKKKQCEKMVFGNGVYRYRQCQRNAIITDADGKCYCKQHSPEETGKRVQKNHTKATEKYRTERRQRHYGYVGEQAIDFLEEIATKLEDNKSPRAMDIVKEIKGKVIELRFKG